MAVVILEVGCRSSTSRNLTGCHLPLSPSKQGVVWGYPAIGVRRVLGVGFETKSKLPSNSGRELGSLRSRVVSLS